MYGWIIREKVSARAFSRRTTPANDPAGTATRWAMRVLVLASLCVGPPALAGEHPVPLDDGTDTAQCGECHEDKTKGKAVHSAMAMGCTACHEVKNENQATNVRLTAATPLALCLSCHADKAVSEAKGPVHPPVAQNCLTCHSPHASDNPYQLLKPTSGDKAANLCLKCHDKGVGVAETGSRHAALDMGCETCHVTHKSGDSSKVEFAVHLNKAPPALCLDCHDVTTEEAVAAHRNQPVAQADCTSCHDAHDSSAPKLMAHYLHPPFADKSCDLCHQPAEKGKVVLNEGGNRALCYMCHDAKQKQVEQSKTQHPVFAVTDNCTGCHNPHGSRTPKLLQASQGQVCAACHEKSSDAVRHGPYDKGQCSVCHDPHGTELPHLTRTDPAKLCAGCHVEQLEIKADEKTHAVALPWNQAIPEDEYAQAIKIGLDAGNRSGHPMAGHPISGKNTKGSGEISCLTCHQPHSSALPKLMPAGVKSGLEVCAKCHKEAAF